MYAPIEHFQPSEYIQTSTGNRICMDRNIKKPQALEIPFGKVIIKSRVSINCEDAQVSIQKYTYISEGTSLNPPSFQSKVIPQTIGSHSFIGRNCSIEAAVVGSGCYISDNCVVHPRAVLKDFVLLEPNTVVPADMVLPPFAVAAGSPAVIVDFLPESTSTSSIATAVSRYRSFIPQSS